MDENRIKEELKEILKKEGLSWELFNQKVGLSDRSTLRRNLLGWLKKANETMSTIDYEITFKKKKK